MIPGEDETHVCGYICYKFIHWALWRTLMRTKYFLFVYHTTSILAKLNTWCFEHSGDIGCSWLVNSSHTDESCEGRNTCLRIYTLLIYSLNTMENTGENKIFFVRSPHHKDFGKAQPWCFEHSGDTSCSWLVNSSHTDESWKGRNTCLRIYTLLIYSLSTLENTGENKIFFLRSPHHKHFGKRQPWCFEHSSDISCSRFVNPSHTDESWEGRNTCLWIYTLWIYLLSTLENTGKNKIFFVRSPRHKHFGKALHLVLWALWWHQLFSTH